MKEYQFIQYNPNITMLDGIYCAKYNSEPCVIRVKDGTPVFVSFIGFIKRYEGEDQVRSSSIFDPKGIITSSVELLVPAQKLVYEK